MWLALCCFGQGALFHPAAVLAQTDTAESTDSASTDSTEKSTTPTVSKEIGEVTNATAGGEPEGWYAQADATVGESVPYRVTGTLPSDWDSFETYYYEFHDTQDEAIVVDAASVSVCLVRAATGESMDITEAFTITYDEEAHVLTAACADLKQAADGITASDTVVLTYTATLDAALAEAGTDGAALNYVYLRYTSDPSTGGIGQTPEDSTALYTWALQIEKVAEDTAEPLSGAGFTIQAEDGRYVSADGTLCEEAVELFTDDAGELMVTGLDAGTYTVRETSAPAGYSAVADFTVEIVSDAASTTAATPTLTLTVKAASARAESISSATGVAVVTVTDSPTIIPPIIGKLPQTGEAAWWLLVAVLVLAGAGVVAAGLFLARRRSRAGASEPRSGAGSDSTGGSDSGARWPR